MPMPGAIRQQADDALANALVHIQARQDAYSAAHSGAFWQGYRTSSVTPTDGATATPDVGTATPADLTGQPWPAAIRSASLPCSLEVHRYQTPRDGWGWLVIIEVTINGTTHRRVVNGAGVESWRSQPWAQVAPGP